jgi:hypothetical protein
MRIQRANSSIPANKVTNNGGKLFLAEPAAVLNLKVSNENALTPILNYDHFLKRHN